MRRLLSLLLLLPATLSAQSTPDAHRGIAERMFQHLLHNRTDSLYANMAESVKPLISPEQLADAIENTESMVGRYQNHGEWALQKVWGRNAYVSTVRFESSELAALVTLNAQGQMLGIQLLPLQLVQRQSTPRNEHNSNVVETADTIVHGDIRLPATIARPANAQGDVPIVVLVHGSGPNDRDETVGSCRPFRDLAQLLAQRGVATLRYDKRTRVYAHPVATLDEEVIDDALAAVALARRYGRRVFVLGHSLGGMLAPTMAQREAGICGIIMLAAPARDLSEVLREQIEHISPPGASPEFKQMFYEHTVQAAPHNFAPLHQTATAQSLRIPILVLQGGRDYQVSMADFDLWSKHLKNNKLAQLKSYPKLNHLFVEGEGASSPMEYYNEGQVAPYVADDVARFVQGN